VLNYKKAGVDIKAADNFVGLIKKKLAAQKGFAPTIPFLDTKYSLSASVDGVGTKLKLAFMFNKHENTAIDLVAMNLNDLICTGAKPLFFLDYISCYKIKPALFEKIVSAISKACAENECQLIGGETAEMPGFYKNNEYDLAGFAVGYIKKGKEILGADIKAGDILIGLKSSGPHANGFSLIRKSLSGNFLKKYADDLLCPTKIYVKEILSCLCKFNAKVKNITGIVHITGGSFYGKLPSILPRNFDIVINKKSWETPEIFNVIQKQGKISNLEMYKTFNMGIGMVLFVRPNKAEDVRKFFNDAVIVGSVENGCGKIKMV
jgi:phosphoribosylformylglycinamidine cyclo-ligase